MTQPLCRIQPASSDNAERIIAARYPTATRVPDMWGIDWFVGDVCVARWSPYTRDITWMETSP